MTPFGLNSDIDYEIVIIDDNSPDGTGEMAHKLQVYAHFYINPKQFTLLYKLYILTIITKSYTHKIYIGGIWRGYDHNFRKGW